MNKITYYYFLGPLQTSMVIESPSERALDYLKVISDEVFPYPWEEGKDNYKCIGVFPVKEKMEEALAFVETIYNPNK